MGVRTTKPTLAPAALGAAFVVLFAIAALAGPAPAGAAERGPADPSFRFGYNENWLAHEGRVRTAAKGGADTIRVVIPWVAVEPYPNAFDWSRFDRLYGRMRANGIRPLWVLADAPCWARDVSERRCERDGPVGYPPADWAMEAFARYAGMVVERYPRTVAIEAWNEPNLFHFWRPGPEPERAARLTAWANHGVDRVKPTVPVLLPGLAPVIDSVPFQFVAYQEFITRAYAEVGLGAWDGVAIHPFPKFQRSDHYLRDIRAHLRRVRVAIGAAGAKYTPIWVTEVGLATDGLRRPYSFAEQAKALVEIHRMLSRAPDVSAMIVHRLIDLDKDLRTAESGWGVIRRNGSKKPSYCALAELLGEGCRRR